MATIVTRSGKGSPLSIAEGDANFTNLNDDKIEYTDISVTTAIDAETSALTYDNTTGVLTFTPVDINGLAALDDFSVTTNASAETSALSYNNATGEFTFTPVDINDLAALDDFVVNQIAASGSGSLAYNNTTGVFSFSPADLTGLMSDLSDDNSPQLGGELDVNGNSIVSNNNGNIQLSPNGTGKISLSSETQVNGNLIIQGTSHISSESNNDLTLQALGTGNVSITGTELNINQPIVNFPNGVAQITAATSVDIVSDTMLVGASSSSTEALITTAASSNCNLKLRGNGTGTIILDDDTAINGNLDVGTNYITTTTSNGDIAVENNGTGVTTINGGQGFTIETGYLNTGTNTDLVLNPNGTGGVFVNAPNAGMVVANTGASGYGVITGSASTGIGISADEFADDATDSKILVTSGGGLTLQAGSGSAATLTGATVDITGDTEVVGDFTVEGVTTLDILNNYIHEIVTDATATGTYTPSASSGNVIYMIPQGNLTINDFAADSIDPGQSITIFIDQSSYSTSYTLTMGDKFLFPGGTAPTLTATGNDLITITCLDDGTATGDNVYIANFVANYQ